MKILRKNVQPNQAINSDACKFCDELNAALRSCFRVRSKFVVGAGHGNRYVRNKLGNIMKLKVVVHEAEDGGYWAEAPSIPGCATQGGGL